MKKAASKLKLLAKQAGLGANGPLPLASRKKKSIAARRADATQKVLADYLKLRESRLCTASKGSVLRRRKALVTKSQRQEGVEVDPKIAKSCCDIAVKIHPQDAHLLGLMVAKSKQPTFYDAKVKITPINYIHILSQLPGLIAENCGLHLSLLAEDYAPIHLQMKRPPSNHPGAYKTWTVYFWLKSRLLKSVRKELKYMIEDSLPQSKPTPEEQREDSRWAPHFPIRSCLALDEARALHAAAKLEWKSMAKSVSFRVIALCLRTRSASAPHLEEVIKGAEWKEWLLVGDEEEPKPRVKHGKKQASQEHEKTDNGSSSPKPVGESTSLDITATEDGSRKILLDPSKDVKFDGPVIDDTAEEIPRTQALQTASSLNDDAPVLPPKRYKTLPNGARAKESTQKKAQLSQCGTGWVQPRPLEKEAQTPLKPKKRDLRKAPTVLEKVSFPGGSGWVRPSPTRSIILERPVPESELPENVEKLPRTTVLDSPEAKVRSGNIPLDQQRSRPTSGESKRPQVPPQRIVLGRPQVGRQAADKQPEQVHRRPEQEHLITTQVPPQPTDIENLQVGKQLQYNSLRSAHGHDVSSNASRIGVLQQNPELGQGESRSKQKKSPQVSSQPSISNLARDTVTRIAGQLEDKPLIKSPKDQATNARAQVKLTPSNLAKGNPAESQNLSMGGAHQRLEQLKQTQVYGSQLNHPGIATVERESADKSTENEQPRGDQATKAARAMSEAMKMLQPYVTMQASIGKSSSESNENATAKSLLGWSNEKKIFTNNSGVNKQGEALSAESIRLMLDPPKPAPSPRKSLPLMEWDAVHKKAVFVKPNFEGLSEEAIAEFKLAQEAMKAEIEKEANPAPTQTPEFFGNTLYKMIGRRQPMLLYNGARKYKVVPENAEPGRHHWPQPVSRAVSSGHEPQHHDPEKRVVPKYYSNNDEHEIQEASRPKEENPSEEANIRYFWAGGSDPEEEIAPRYSSDGKSPLYDTQTEKRESLQHQHLEKEVVPDIQRREGVHLNESDEGSRNTEAIILEMQNEAAAEYIGKKGHSKGRRKRELAARSASGQSMSQEAKANSLESTYDSSNFKAIRDKINSGLESQSKPRQWNIETKTARSPGHRRLREGKSKAERGSRITKPVRDQQIPNSTQEKDHNEKATRGAAKQERGREKMVAREKYSERTGNKEPEVENEGARGEDVEFTNAMRKWAAEPERKFKRREHPYGYDDTRNKSAKPWNGGGGGDRLRRVRRLI
ncbi:hypothetical protein PZA11_005572 [Diplocarpon coronariae]|nr:hypothetical protein JHW43_000088 [Diplocarpon mali]